MSATSTPIPGRRIVVVGTSGCGKTTVAQRLTDTLGLTYICSDAIIWGPNWTLVPHEQRVPKYDKATQAQGWTIDGNFGGTGHPQDEIILQRADTLVWLDLTRHQVHGQLLRRTIRRAWTKEPFWHGNTESWRLSFFSRDSILLWSLKYYTIRKQQYTKVFAGSKWSHLNKIRLTSRRQVDAWLAAIERQQARD